MAESKCNIGHKFGPFIKKKNYYSRSCSCCGYESKYPDCVDFENEVMKQDDAKLFLEVLLRGDVSLIKSSDDLIKLTACLSEYLSYLYVDKRIQKEIKVKLQFFNDYYNIDFNNERLILINNFISYLSLHFRFENYEITNGFGTFPENLVVEYDKIFHSIEVMLDNELNKMNDVNINDFDVDDNTLEVDNDCLDNDDVVDVGNIDFDGASA